VVRQVAKMYIHAWMTKRGVGTYDKIAYKVNDNCSYSGEVLWNLYIQNTYNGILCFYIYTYNII